MSSGYPVSRVGGRFVAGDIDEDGDADAVAFYDAGDSAARLHAWLSTHTALTYQGANGWWSVSSGYPLTRLG